MASSFIGAVLRPIVVCIALAAMTLAGCSSSGSIAPKQNDQMPAAEQLRNIQTKRLGEGAVIGGIATGILLGTITAVAGGNARQIATNTAVGFVVGAAGGAIFASTVNKSAEQQANEQERYRLVLRDVDNNIASYKRAASSASAITKSENVRVASLNAKLQAGSISAMQYRTEIADAKDNIAALDRLIASADTDIADMTTLIGTTGPSDMKLRKDQLITQKAALEAQRQTLLEAYSRVAPEVGIKV